MNLGELIIVSLLLSHWYGMGAIYWGGMATVLIVSIVARNFFGVDDD
jgi:hypothetical protein